MEGDGGSTKKAWRGDSGRDYASTAGYQDQAYETYTRKGYGNDAYGSDQKYPIQRDGSDRYYNRDNYASNTQSDATWKPREASPWYDEYGNSANYNSAGWNNSNSTGGRYRGGEYPADPYYAGGEGGFGRTNTRQDGYDYPAGGLYRSSSLERSDVLPSSNAYYRGGDGYATQRYNYDYSGRQDRIDERAYSAEGTTPSQTNRYTTARGGGKFGFANTFHANNATNFGTGGNGKYANSFKARQYSFGAKKAARTVGVAKNNSSSSSAGSSDEAQVEQKEPEKPKVITGKLLMLFYNVCVIVLTVQFYVSLN